MELYLEGWIGSSHEDSSVLLTNDLVCVEKNNVEISNIVMGPKGLQPFFICSFTFVGSGFRHHKENTVHASTRKLKCYN